MIKFSFEVPAVDLKHFGGVYPTASYFEGRWRVSFSEPFVDDEYPVFADILIGLEGQHNPFAFNVYKTENYIEFGSLPDGARLSVYIP